MKLLSPEVALYLYKSIVCPCMEYCCHVWAGTPNCYLELLDKLQKQIHKTVGPSLAASLEPLAHCWNVASVEMWPVFSIGTTLVYVLHNWLNWSHFLFLKGGLLVILIDCMHDFSVTIPRCYQDVYVNSFFPRTARFWNSLLIDCFSLTMALSLE